MGVVSWYLVCVENAGRTTDLGPIKVTRWSKDILRCETGSPFKVPLNRFTSGGCSTDALVAANASGAGWRLMVPTDQELEPARARCVRSVLWRRRHCCSEKRGVIERTSEKGGGGRGRALITPRRTQDEGLVGQEGEKRES